jgi:TatA/E family protein of Tat protein translocase
MIFNDRLVRCRRIRKWPVYVRHPGVESFREKGPKFPIARGRKERAGQRLACSQKEPFTPAMLSPSDTAIVFLLALLLFGPEQLPRIARQLGEAMRHMQATTHSFMNEMERAARSTEVEPVEPAPPPFPELEQTKVEGPQPPGERPA